MQTMPDRISQPTLRRLQLRVSRLLRPLGGHHQAMQEQGSSNAPCDSTLPEQPAQVRDRWFAERTGLGTPLSQSELEHGVRAAIISATILS